MSTTRRDWAVVAAITALALALRAWRLDAPLWYDEILTLLNYARLPLAEIVTTYDSLNNHVFFSVQAHLAITLLGETPAALRLPAMLFGAATVPLFWTLIRAAGAPVLHAHLAALLLALNYHHIWFSQNARGYTGLVFWCLLALVLLQRARASNGGIAWLGVAVAGALAIYTHLSAGFYLAALFAAHMAAEIAAPADGRRMARVQRAVAAFAGMGVAALLLHAPMLGDMVTTFGAVSEPAATGTPDPLARWQNPLLSLVAALADLPVPLPVTLVALPLLGAVLGVGWLRVLRHAPVAAWSIPFGIAVTVAVLLGAGMRIWPRYFLVDVVLLLWPATAGIAALSAALLPRRLAGPAMTAGWCAAILLSGAWASRNYVAPKQDYAGAIALAEARADPGDRFATFGLSALPVVGYYAPGWTVLEDLRDLDTALAQDGALWVVFGFEGHSRGHYPEITDRLDSTFKRVATRPGTLGGGTVLVLRHQ